MPLPQGVRLVQEAGENKVYAVGNGGRWWVPNPTEAARMFGNDWASHIERVAPSTMANIPIVDSAQTAFSPSNLGTNYGAPVNINNNAPPLSSTSGAYQQAYQNARDVNAQLYGQITQGYQRALDQQRASQAGVQTGYGQLRGDVMGQLSGVEAAQRQAINEQYAQAQGSAMQGLASRGLGNTTVGSAVQRGLLADKTKADIALTGQMGQLGAGYLSQLGLAGLGYAGQATQDQLAGAQGLYGVMGGFREQTPDPLGYLQLGQQQQQFAAQLPIQQYQASLKNAGGQVIGGPALENPAMRSPEQDYLAQYGRQYQAPSWAVPVWGGPVGRA